jgi:glutaredoxin-dependent peroxiredoxin
MAADAKTEIALLARDDVEKRFAAARRAGQRHGSVPSDVRAGSVLHPPQPPPPMPIAVGSKAPDFTLKTKAADGLKDVKLSDNFGKKQTVLLFFPAAFTGVCTQEMCDQTGGLAEYEKLGAQVYAISVDTPFAQEAWAQQNKIGITLLSDLNKTTTKAYDVVFPNLAGIGDTSARAAFVIGKDGVVKYAEQTPTPKDLPNFGAVKAALAK